MREDGAISTFAFWKRTNKFHDPMPKINGQRKDGAELDNDGVHFPETVLKIDVEQRFADAQMRRRTYREEFRQAFDDSKKQR